MPDDDVLPEGCKKSEFDDTSLTAVRNYVGNDYKVVYCDGLFPDTAKGINVPFSFVHLDADIYQSTVAGIAFFYPLLQRGGRMVLDDYKFYRCPGVQKAVEEYFKDVKDVVLLSEELYSLTIIKL